MALLLIATELTAATRLADLCGIEVGGKSPWETKAAEILTIYAGKMAGNSLTGPADVFIGEPALREGLITSETVASVGKGGYVIAVKGGRVGIAGKNDGVLAGACALLKKFGLRYYALGCERLPAEPITLDDFTESCSPPFSLRKVDYTFRDFEDHKGFPTVLLGFSPEFEDEQLSVIPHPNWKKLSFRGDWLHSVCHMVPREEFLKTHPEYFAQSPDGGEKVSGSGTANYQLCYANKDVQNLIYQRLRELILASPEAEFFSLSLGDNWDWCECLDCRAKDPIPIEQKGHYRSMMDRWLSCTRDIFEKLVAEFPDKTILTLAYFGTESPPARETIPAGVTVMFCPCGSCGTHGLACPRNADMYKNLLGWKELSPKFPLMFFDYPENYTMRLNLYFTHDAMRDKIAMYHKLGGTGIVHCGTPTVFTDLYLYTQGLLAWQPDMPDEEYAAHEKLFLREYYGKAAEPMADYLALVRSQAQEHCAAMYARVSSLADRNYAEKAYRFFAAAEQAVAEHPVELKRVRFEKLSGLVYTDVVMRLIPRSAAGRLKLFQELVNLTAEASLRHPGSLPWDELARREANIYLRHKGYSPHNRDASLQEWFCDPALVPLLACRGDADFAALATELGMDSESPMEFQDTSHVILFEPHPDKNKEWDDPTGEKRRTVLLDGGAAFVCPFEYNGRVPLTGGKLTLRGLDHDKDGQVTLEIKLNGTIIFNGPNHFGKDKWGSFDIQIPDGLVIPGKNLLAVRNTLRAASWANWVFVSEMQLAPSNSRWTRKVWQEDFAEPDNAKYFQCNMENGILKAIPDNNVTFRGQPTLKLTTKEVQENANLQFIRTIPADENLRPGMYRATFYLKSEHPTSVRLLIFSENNKGGILNKLVDVSPQWTNASVTFNLPKADAGYALQLPRLMLNYGGENTYYLSPVTLAGEDE